jgi:hypothetical protein
MIDLTKFSVIIAECSQGQPKKGVEDGGEIMNYNIFQKKILL